MRMLKHDIQQEDGDRIPPPQDSKNINNSVYSDNKDIIIRFSIIRICTRMIEFQ